MQILRKAIKLKWFVLKRKNVEKFMLRDSLDTPLLDEYLLNYLCYIELKLQ